MKPHSNVNTAVSAQILEMTNYDDLLTMLSSKIETGIRCKELNKVNSRNWFNSRDHT